MNKKEKYIKELKNYININSLDVVNDIVNYHNNKYSNKDKPTIKYNINNQVKYSDIINSNISKFENKISNYPILSYLYARDIVNGRFILGEKSIANCDNPKISMIYSLEILMKRCKIKPKNNKNIEKIIKNSERVFEEKELTLDKKNTIEYLLNQFLG